MLHRDASSLSSNNSFQNVPYSSSISSLASSSTASVWSDAFSQSSDDSTSTSSSEFFDQFELGHCPRPLETERTCEPTSHEPAWYDQSRTASNIKPTIGQQTSSQIPQELRCNPRRSSRSVVSRTGCPPSLVRQRDRKLCFVDNLVDSSTQIVEAIWPLSSPICRAELGSKAVLPLRTFIQETLRRSRSSFSTLQVALYYLILLKPHVPKTDFTMEQSRDIHDRRALLCGRRMFLAALILASKYLQDRNYSARAWSKISGLAVHEINQNETAFLLAVDWKLHIPDDIFQRWTDFIIKYTPSQPSNSLCPQTEEQIQLWKNIVLSLSPRLDINCTPPGTATQALREPALAASSRSFWCVVREEDPSPLQELVDESTPTPRQYGTPATMAATRTLRRHSSYSQLKSRQAAEASATNKQVLRRRYRLGVDFVTPRVGNPIESGLSC